LVDRAPRRNMGLTMVELHAFLIIIGLAKPAKEVIL